MPRPPPRPPRRRREEEARPRRRSGPRERPGVDETAPLFEHLLTCIVYRDKLNNLVLFDKGTYDKLYKEVPTYKLITPSIVSERLKVCKLNRLIMSSYDDLL